MGRATQKTHTTHSTVHPVPPLPIAPQTPLSSPLHFFLDFYPSSLIVPLLTRHTDQSFIMSDNSSNSSSLLQQHRPRSLSPQQPCAQPLVRRSFTLLEQHEPGRVPCMPMRRAREYFIFSLAIQRVVGMLLRTSLNDLQLSQHVPLLPHSTRQSLPPAKGRPTFVRPRSRTNRLILRSRRGLYHPVPHEESRSIVGLCLLLPTESGRQYPVHHGR